MSFLQKYLHGKNRDDIKYLIRKRLITADGVPCEKAEMMLKTGSKIEVGEAEILADKNENNRLRGVKIVFEDAHLLVVEKESGLLSIATDSEKRETAYSILSDYVKKQHHLNKIFIVHRLDRETSGLMLFAKSEEVKTLLQESWNESVLQRTYVAVVEGVMEKYSGTISSYLFETSSMIVHSSQNPEKGQWAVTGFLTLEKGKYYSLVKLDLETGRKHQIRVHMCDIGHPVAGDKKYGAVTNPLKRMGLHAMVLSFVHPVSGEKLFFDTPVPGSFLKITGKRSD
ncbi:MAG: hypothetical protein A2W91_00535 [Bacteroidetes bacterium GWF2_38_335]|nr:MAG: hypothetical protein A2W91_00535 [Bacteroidetes bacterium GWF2_38_335]OFY78319.1 MAG: hypothetical protein A2281_03915 [Bacteroidetes bacterium RIFOXYA12_FULL_38_20]HBS87485.1 RNA pseudouridine synthase [Bacteroidales bacterium]